ncbi:MAG: hypothetical protein P4L62_01000 [Candidatus Pacebacteria bacterium]|nr:hypothetical protein [Candidatus Paceibacterota bacterium]MDR3582925.1 hypothetical protein [Candidatus Paceibacterota bacterium]
MDKENLQENMNAAKEKAKDKYAELKQTAAEKREKAEKYISENPKKAALMAAGIGAVIGLIIGCAVSKERKIELYDHN